MANTLQGRRKVTVSTASNKKGTSITVHVESITETNAIATTTLRKGTATTLKKGTAMIAAASTMPGLNCS